MPDNLPSRVPPQPMATIDFPSMITMALEKNVDPATIQSFLKMYNDQQDRYKEEAFNYAVGAVRAEVTVVMKNAINKFAGWRYANYQGLMEMLQPILNRHAVGVGFDLGQQPGQPEVPADHERVTLVVGHGGYAERSSWRDELTSRTGSRGGGIQQTEQQAGGSAITYAQRRLLQAKFNIVAADEDDDGEANRDTNGKPGNSKPQDDATAAQRAWRGRNVAQWADTLVARLAAAQTLEGIDDLLNKPPVSEWLADQVGGPTKEERTKINVARMDATKRVVNAAPAAPAAPATTEETKPVELSAAALELLARINSCQTGVALDSLLTAPEFSRPFSALPIAEGDQLNVALKQRYLEVPRV